MNFNVAIIIDTKPLSGGGIQSLNTAINLINLKDSKINWIIFTTQIETYNMLNELDISVRLIKINFLDKLFVFLSKNIIFINLIKRYNLKTLIEKYLLKQKIKFIYFPSPSNKYLYFNSLNYATTVWDLCHLQYKEFPEVYKSMEFDLRETHYQKTLKKSSLVITESDELSELVSKYYNIDKKRIISLPLSINFSFAKKAIDLDIQKLELPKKFFFYPAQFWPHKNHITLLKAFKQIKRNNNDWYLLFCGINTGNLEHIKKYAKSLGIMDNIIIKNYVNGDEIHEIYRRSSCVIMTTFFGPTNIPPLEAWHFEKPLIYSDHLKKNIENCALFVDPLDKYSISNAMLKVINSDEIINKIINNGKDTLRKLNKNRNKSYMEINSTINEIRKINQLYE